MSTEPMPPSPAPPPAAFNFADWWQKLGLSGKLLLGGAVVGVIAVFLPLISFSMKAGPISSSGSAAAIDHWKGVLILLAYVGAGIMTFVFYKSRPDVQQRNVVGATVGLAGIALLLALWLFIDAARAASRTTIAAGPVQVDFAGGVSIGMGGYLILLSGLAVAAGAFLKARDARLF